MNPENQWLLAPYPDWSAPLLDRIKAQQVERLDLHKIELETIVRFCGQHPSSVYTCVITPDENIKIWLGGSHTNCARGSVDAIYSLDLSPDSKPERGVMEIGRFYEVPTFKHTLIDGRWQVALNYHNPRVERYTSILVQTRERS